MRLGRTGHGCAKAAKSQRTVRRPRQVIRGGQEALPRIHLLSWHLPTEPIRFQFRPLSPRSVCFYHLIIVIRNKKNIVLERDSSLKNVFILALFIHLYVNLYELFSVEHISYFQKCLSVF